jgi:hypothetical protein
MRTFLWCLMMLTVAVHGFAVASMTACGPHHAALAQRADSHHHDHGAGAAHHHHDAASTIEAEDGGLDGLLKGLGVKCSACAACCTLSAVPATPVPALIFLPSISVAVPSASSSYTGIVPDGLERPPSQRLA